MALNQKINNFACFIRIFDVIQCRYVFSHKIACFRWMKVLLLLFILFHENSFSLSCYFFLFFFAARNRSMRGISRALAADRIIRILIHDLRMKKKYKTNVTKLKSNISIPIFVISSFEYFGTHSLFLNMFFFLIRSRLQCLAAQFLIWFV